MSPYTLLCLSILYPSILLIVLPYISLILSLCPSYILLMVSYILSGWIIIFLSMCFTIMIMVLRLTLSHTFSYISPHIFLYSFPIGFAVHSNTYSPMVYLVSLQGFAVSNINGLKHVKRTFRPSNL